MQEDHITDSFSIASLSSFFNNHHDKLVCTADSKGAPNISLMGTPRLLEDSTIEFEVSDRISVTLENIKENKEVLFMAYVPGARARDYKGVRIYATVTDILTSGEKIDRIRTMIRERYGEEKAAEFQASVACRIRKVRPIVDRGQRWNEPPFADD